MVWLQILVTIIVSFAASGGFWSYLDARRRKKDSKIKVILGLGYDRIVTLGVKYINRGWITKEEYENLETYIYRPYHELRPDDGSVRKIMQDVNRLPIRKI